MSRFRDLVSGLALVLSDFAALLITFLAGYFLRAQVLTRVIHFKEPPLPLSIQLNPGLVTGFFIIVVILAFEKLYVLRLSFWEETRRLLRGISLSFILMIALVFISRSYAQFSRVVIVIAWLLSLGVFPLFRLVTKKLLIMTGLWRRRILVLGTDGMAKAIALSIKNNRTLGYTLAGFLADDPTLVGRTVLDDHKVLGTVDEIERFSRELQVKDIVIALPELSQSRLIEMTETCEKVTPTIRIAPGFASLFTMGVEIESLGDVITLSVARNLVKPWNIFVKRLFEFVLTILLLIILFPLFLVIGLAIRLDSRGKVIYTQERLGFNGKKIRIFKFRSMYIDSEKRLKNQLETDPRLQREWESFQKIKNGDPRVTRVGRFIRKHSLDELPQMFNVLRGDMNLVGPRPYLPRERDLLKEKYEIISRVKPGLTGLWQVSGRNLLLFTDRVLLDEYYIRNWSLWLDIVILLRTIKVLAKAEGAY